LESGVRPGHLYAETLYSGLSIGTETAAYTGQPPLRAGVAYPRLLGYCNVAVVREIEPEGSKLKVGDVILTTQSHQSGFICHESEVLAQLPPGVNLHGASLSYLAFLGASSLQKARYRAGEWVTVMGLGPIGLAALKWLACSEAKTVAIGRRVARLEMARGAGAALCVDSDDAALLKSVRDLTAGRGSDIVLTTVNSWGMWRLALELAREHGRIAVLGFPGRGEPVPSQNPLDSALFYVKQLSILACGQVSEWDAKEVDALKARQDLIGSMVNLMQEKRLDLTDLISDIVPFRDLESMYLKAATEKDHFITAVLAWPAADGASS
jgi:threonine dehydrogenase-like Zn-dependent dehydrogenase